MSDQAVCFCGKPFTEMTREELIEALKVTGNMLRQYRSPEQIEAYALGRIEMIKRK